MRSDLPEEPDASGLRVGIVVSGYHREITGALRAGAEACFREAGGGPDDLVVVPAPGAWELVPLAATLAEQGDVDAVVAIGCIVTGETTHDRYLAQAVAGALASLGARTGVPVSFGVLTCQTVEQAAARAGGARGNKGIEAMAAALHAARAIAAIRGEGAAR